MNPEQLEKLNSMEERIEQIERSGLLDFSVDGFRPVTDSDVTNAIGSLGGDTFDFPDQWIPVRYNGEIGRIPFYKESNF